MKPELPPSASARPAPGADTEEMLRRRLRSVASLVEIARQVQAGEPSERLCRQLLIAAMDALHARSGAVFGSASDGRVRLIEAIGGRDDAVPGSFHALADSALVALRDGDVIRILGHRDREPWRRLMAEVDGRVEPCALVRLPGPRGSVGFLLAGGMPPICDGAGDDHGLLSAMGGLFEIIARRGEPAAVHAAGGPPGDGDGAMRAGAGLEELRRLEPALRDFVGQTPSVERLLSDLVGVAGTNCPVLFEGESGTGKEQLARIAHRISRGDDTPFEAVNCGAIPEALIESELFGHVAGAFTGATRDHRGVFERAGGGTVFLDEVAEMPPAAQVRLLRVLQEEMFSPVGAEELRRCSARIMAAANRDLHREVAAGRFRQDLFYRLNVFPIRVPPLRERREDIPLLVRHFLARAAAESGLPPRDIELDAMRRLSVYFYPGNVRELQNIVRALLVEAREASRIADRHVIAVFSRHRVRGDDPQRPAPDGDGAPGVQACDVGRWVLGELRRYFFNLALAERMLEDRRRLSSHRRSIPVVSRSGLTYYLHGEFLRALAESGWDPDAAALRVAGEARSVARVRNKLDHLVSGALAVLRRGGPTPADRWTALRARFAKLPECYDSCLRRLAEEFERGRWA